MCNENFRHYKHREKHIRKQGGKKAKIVKRAGSFDRGMGVLTFLFYFMVLPLPPETIICPQIKQTFNNYPFIFQVVTARQCQSLCDANEECQYFTWWSDGMFKHICMHHASCTRLDFKCQHCHAGPRSSGCPLRRRRNRHRQLAIAPDQTNRHRQH